MGSGARDSRQEWLEVCGMLVEDPCLIDDWATVARRLDVSEADIKQLRNSLRLETTTYLELFYRILMYWQAKKGRAATIPVLIDTLHNCDCNDAAGKLRERFGV